MRYCKKERYINPLAFTYLGLYLYDYRYDHTKCQNEFCISEQTSSGLDKVIDVDTKSLFDDVINSTASELAESRSAAQDVNLFQLSTTSTVVRHAVALVDDRRLVVGLDDLEANCSKVN